MILLIKKATPACFLERYRERERERLCQIIQLRINERILKKEAEK
uniref:Uncharacterized protein n=1 Tax=Rhizophora mucronata TaxID=61149 RepID=A0A2P2LEF7_RHIMU